jgi:hypothetical protein
MAKQRIEVAPALVAEGRRLYEKTLMPMRDIAALLGISRRTLQNRVNEWKWQPRQFSGRPIELLHAMRGAVMAVATDPSPVSAGVPADGDIARQRKEIAARIQGVVVQHLSAVEKVLAALGAADALEAERESRTLASLSRTVREIAVLNASEPQAPRDEADDDPIPSDIDEFRRELARRIRGFIEARRTGAGGVSGEPEGSLG